MSLIEDLFQDVEIAVVAHALVQEDVEEGFWADDSDTEEELSDDEDNDPECISDRWDCLTCGLKNKPFVRYCSKCWQVSYHYNTCLSMSSFLFIGHLQMQAKVIMLWDCIP